MHMMYDRVAPTRQEAVNVDDSREYPVSFFGDLDLVFHSTEEVYVTLMNVAYVPRNNTTCFHFTLSWSKRLL